MTGARLLWHLGIAVDDTRVRWKSLTRLGLGG